MKRKTVFPKSVSCSHRSPQFGQLDTFERVVHDYVKEYQLYASREMKWYASQPNLERATEVAALSKLPSGKRHPHQRRIPLAVLEEVRDRLQALNLRGCRTFHELFETVRDEIIGIHRAGELLVYDVAHRIGAYLGLKPERIYLHAGTRKGASALGLGRGVEYLNPLDLPVPFQRLSPAEVEDCLCIYKDDLQQAVLS